MARLALSGRFLALIMYRSCYFRIITTCLHHVNLNKKIASVLMLAKSNGMRPNFKDPGPNTHSIFSLCPGGNQAAILCLASSLDNI